MVCFVEVLTDFHCIESRSASVDIELCEAAGYYEELNTKRSMIIITNTLASV